MGLSLARDIRREVSAMVRPRERITVVEAAQKYVKVRTASGAVTDWDPELTPYMVEPMNLLTSRHYDAVIFVGPAQSGKTQGLITCFMAYIIKCDPSDFMILQTTKGTARDFDTQVVKRAFRDSPELKKELASGSKSDNTFDKVFRSGSVLFQRWPSINELSGKPLKYMLMTDYDRMTQDVGGEGSVFAQGSKRTTKFMSRGMSVVDTSPGYKVEDPSWRPPQGKEHAAPPCAGALSLYNMGDMRRWYVKCPECGEYFMPPPDEKGLDFNFSKDMFGATITDMNREVSFVCAANGCLIPINKKREMNAPESGLWVPQGCSVEDGKLVGVPRKSRIASFWFPGILAAYSNPEEMAQKFLNGSREYDITGEEQNLKACINVDFGAPYVSRNSVSDISAEDYKRRAEDLPVKHIPEGCRFIIAAIDVQSRGFVVQITGYGLNKERWIIDRYEIRISKRIENDEPVPCSPDKFAEDWHLISEKVLSSTYPLGDNSGRVMKLLKTACDSAGKDGVTENAYDYWRYLRKNQQHKDFILIKGERPRPNANKPTVRKSYPENTDKSKKKANARGEVPVWILNTTILKDTVSNDLGRDRPGNGYIHFPDWLDLSFYEELTAEVKTESGWENPSKRPNESFDLIGYADAALKAKLIEDKAVVINWDAPPDWAKGWDENNLVYFPDDKKPEIKTQQQSLMPPAADSWINHEHDDEWIK
ncbi:MAG: putative terminase large subunit [Prokaryotic dsDNA virus sp.]|uniref:phage terminase large subunit family protein n=1 Tax=Methylophaga sp. UBA2689 TaxID=1946878 RepID=UPI00118BA9AD|nr:terminase gpA endonuclease subunit [Methylophaga sp. UBA2689]QDP47094.1 MAG: putative terminase large subunit [Prokaryotic dsDNA virus sp.]